LNDVTNVMASVSTSPQLPYMNIMSWQ